MNVILDDHLNDDKIHPAGAMEFPEYANRWDVAIASALLNDALSQGWTVSVNDGEEDVVEREVDSAVISGAMMTTDVDTLIFRKGGMFVGTMLLVWGNSGECIADGTMDNGGPFDQFMDRAERRVNALFGMRN